MNNKGQVLFFTLMLSIVIFILAFSLAGPTKSFIDSARNSTTDEGHIGLGCDDMDSLSTYDQAACVASDMYLFYFIAGIIGIGGAVLVAKLVFQ